ncbi:helix-turn-helix domain-containing protein [Anaerosphaera multitolerans]|uniref:XRE family transcriptional regulator n=1 Tax=Anaerosphaera multitolerans TaxID=2487351 RepID=A0A437S5N4_9FIRM|nr:helix-turn-helix transcriptional regulator [Anaerosphaera multitolerans]RVU54319.1 XRE family transcriptional regulator [Anaerosphaera multitolerans]
MRLNERLEKLRKDKGLSQEEVSNYLGVSRRTISKWEKGTSNPDLNNIVKLGELYNVSMDYILKGNGKEEVDINTENSEVKVEKKTKSKTWLMVLIIIFLFLLLAALIILMVNWYPREFMKVFN